MRDTFPAAFRRFALPAILLLATFLRLWHINHESLWFDEAATVHIVNKPLPEMFGLIKSDERTPPLHYVILHVWIKLFGDSEFSVRLPSAIAGIGAVYVLYVLVRKLFGADAALVAALLLAMNRYHILYSQEARAYELMVFLGLLSTHLFVRLTRLPSAKLEAAYVGVTALMLYAHLYGIFVLLAQHIAWIASRAPQKKIRPQRWIILNAAIACLFAAWLPTSFHWARDVQQSFWIPPLTVADIPCTYRTYAGSTPMLILLGALALLGIVRFHRRRGIILILGIILLPVVIPIVISILTKPTFTHRYGLIAICGLDALAAAGFIAMRNVPLRAATLLAVIFFAATATLPSSDKPQWREAAAYLASHMNPTDIAVMSRKNTTYLYDYYVHRPDVKRFGFDGSAIPVTLPLPPGEHVWLILHSNPSTKEEILARGDWRVVISESFRGIEILELWGLEPPIDADERR